MYNIVLPIAAGCVIIVVAIFKIRKVYRLWRPINIKPGKSMVYQAGLDVGLGPDEIRAHIVNRSSESQYIIKCEARGTYSLRHILMTHIRNPLIPPRLYPTIWYGAIVFNFMMEGESIKLDLHQPINLSYKLSDVHNFLVKMDAPFFFIKVTLSSGKTVSSRKLRTPQRWTFIWRNKHD